MVVRVSVCVYVCALLEKYVFVTPTCQICVNLHVWERVSISVGKYTLGWEKSRSMTLKAVKALSHYVEQVTTTIMKP